MNLIILESTSGFALDILFQNYVNKIIYILHVEVVLFIDNSKNIRC